MLSFSFIAFVNTCCLGLKPVVIENPNDRPRLLLCMTLLHVVIGHGKYLLRTKLGCKELQGILLIIIRAEGIPGRHAKHSQAYKSREEEEFILILLHSWILGVYLG